jgi:hypothetical protein
LTVPEPGWQAENVERAEIRRKREVLAVGERDCIQLEWDIVIDPAETSAELAKRCREVLKVCTIAGVGDIDIIRHRRRAPQPTRDTTDDNEFHGVALQGCQCTNGIEPHSVDLVGAAETVQGRCLICESGCPLCRRESEEHADLCPVDSGSSQGTRLEAVTTRIQKPLQRVHAGRIHSALDPGDRRLSDAGSSGETALRQSGTPASISKRVSDVHRHMIADGLSSFERTAQYRL